MSFAGNFKLLISNSKGRDFSDEGFFSGMSREVHGLVEDAGDQEEIGFTAIEDFVMRHLENAAPFRQLFSGVASGAQGIFRKLDEG
jgi:hypothetical protein